MTEQRAVDALAALGNPTRLRLYRLLVRAGDEGLNAGDIQARVEVPASTLAHHLTALARADLILQERRGREVVSRVNYGVMNALLAFLGEHCCAGLEALDDTCAA